MTPKPAAAASTGMRFHGAGLRGADAPRSSRTFEGRFGRMFRSLPPAIHELGDLDKLATKMMADLEVPKDGPDPEENSGISAGYTYLGQFIDHDLTFDPVSSLDRVNDPEALTDFRTPRFDLDCVYGRGPDDQPYLYQDDGVQMLMGRAITGNPLDPNTKDVPRNSAGRALIGDKRNDENTIVSQMQSAFLRFHNRVFKFLKDQGEDFSVDEVQRAVRWHYQYVVLNDFLPTIIGKENFQAIFPHGTGDAVKHPPVLKFYEARNDGFIPIEFSTAAYRFGHSMVRPDYRLNLTSPRLPIFSMTGESLLGFREYPSDRAIDWGLFFKGVKNNVNPATDKERVQPAYKIDTSLVNPLANLPAPVASNPNSLILRNLKRGLMMSLPSGQSVARAMGVDPIDDKKLLVGKATEEDMPANNKPITDVSAKFADNAPLWFYILAEAQQQFKNDKTPLHLGPAGGRMAGETFAGLLMSDGHSYLRQYPRWKPFPEFTAADGSFGMAELIKQSMLA